MLKWMRSASGIEESQNRDVNGLDKCVEDIAAQVQLLTLTLFREAL